MGRRDQGPADGFCATLRPTQKQFERPFRDYVRDVFRRHPDWACFKVVPPAGWAPRKSSLASKFSRIQIATPIKQHVFVQKGGAYMAILEEQKGMTAAEFKRIACSPEHAAPAKGHAEDALLERAFWKQITVNPPLYGADTPTSLFDRHLPWGWNLRRLDCLLKDYDLPKIPGVNTPMAYFGMWKSFFAWHKEDVDLYSVNYNHCGAAKVWYCVPPSCTPRFDAMARQLFPQAAAACPAFMRHKDVMISPAMLRAHSVPYVQAKQAPGEFMVLNAAAYHAGFNLGFNCAEAVNFALPEWLEVGRESVGCECDALPDSVQLDMGLFFPELREPDSEQGSDGESEGEENEEEQPKRRAGHKRRAGAAAAAAGGGGSVKRGREAEVGTPSPLAKRRRAAAARSGSPKRAPPGRLVAAAAAYHRAWGATLDDRPMALVDRRAAGSQELVFSLVHRLARPSSAPGAVRVGVLEEGPDGRYRATEAVQEVRLGARYPKLTHVQAEWERGAGRRKGGWKLTTPRKRILM